jgi:Cell cycle protein
MISILISIARSRSSPVVRAGLLATVPLAVGALGVRIMARSLATSAQLGLQIGALALGLALALVVAALGARRLGAAAPWAAGASLVILAATLAGEGMLGVHRWIALGPIRLHASSILSPMILAGAAALSARGRSAWAAALLLTAQVVHALQPDAGQATALAVGSAVLLFSSASPTAMRVGAVAALAALAAWAWGKSDPLPEVPIVEGIVGLAREEGLAMQALAIASLAAIPVALGLALRRAPTGEPLPGRARVAVVAYLATTLLVPLFGSYPVPVMGFGASPILGAALCVGIVAAG